MKLCFGSKLFVGSNMNADLKLARCFTINHQGFTGYYTISIYFDPKARMNAEDHFSINRTVKDMQCCKIVGKFLRYIS